MLSVVEVCLGFFFLQKQTSNTPTLVLFVEEAKSIRDKRRAKEAKERAEAQANAKQLAEEEERDRNLNDAKMEAEAKPGMFWNKDTREYEYLHDQTAESWRD